MFIGSAIKFDTVFAPVVYLLTVFYIVKAAVFDLRGREWFIVFASFVEHFSQYFNISFFPDGENVLDPGRGEGAEPACK